MRVKSIGATLGVAIRAIRRRPLRSALQAATAAVAIATVVATLALLEGSRRLAEHDLRAVGSLTVQVHRDPTCPPEAPCPELTDASVREIREAAGAAAADVVPARVVQFSARAGDRPPVLLPVVATTPGYLGMFDGRLLDGRWLRDDDLAEDRPVAVLDEEAARTLFGRVDVRGETVSLTRGARRLEVEVVGVLEDPFALREHFRSFDSSRGARHVTARLLTFENVHVPLGLLSDEPYETVLARAPDRERLPALTEAMERWAERAVAAAGAGEEAPERLPLFVWSRGAWIEIVLETIGDLSILGNLVWGLVLVVAMILLTTVTLVAVRQRYPEVAIRRTEGATRGAIVLQLAFEGALVSLAGGIVGIGVGAVAARVLAGLVDWPPAFEAGDVALALGLAVLVGLGGSALPARRAARLDPVRVLSGR